MASLTLDSRASYYHLEARISPEAGPSSYADSGSRSGHILHALVPGEATLLAPASDIMPSVSLNMCIAGAIGSKDMIRTDSYQEEVSQWLMDHCRARLPS